MKLPCTKSGKLGNMVWQRNRYGQICYPAFYLRTRTHLCRIESRD